MTRFHAATPEDLWADLEALWALRARLLESHRARLVDLAAVERRLKGVMQLLMLEWSAVQRPPATPAQFVLTAQVCAARNDVDTVLALANPSFENVAIGVARGAKPDYIELLLRSPHTIARRLALQVLRCRRQWPGDDVISWLKHDDGVTAELCTFLALETGQVQCLPQIKKYLDDGWHSVARACALAVWADHGAAWLASNWQRESWPLLRVAPILAIRLPPEQFTPQLNAIARTGDALQAIRFCAWAGRTRAVPWLLSLLPDENLGPAAADAVAHITGVQLEEMLPQGESPNPDFAWPSTAAMGEWWQGHAARFSPEVRYLRGQPVTAEWLESTWQSGVQQDRAQVALEWAVLNPARGVADHTNVGLML